MKLSKNLKKIFIPLFCAVIILCTGFLALNFQNGGNAAYAFNTENVSDTIAVGEIWKDDQKKFDKRNFTQLLQLITGDESVTPADLELSESVVKTQATSIKSAASFRGVNSGKDIVVSLGGLNWTPVYLSLDTSSNPILTLWLADIITSLPEGKKIYSTSSPTEEPTSKDEWNGLSSWNSGFTPKDSGTGMPDSMYGTSYIRSVTLNNGGMYTIVSGGGTTSGKTKTFTKRDDSIFSPFTITEGSNGAIANFLQVPSKMPWQNGTTQQIGVMPSSGEKRRSNENLKDTNNSDYSWYSSSYNFSAKTGYSNWGNDLLWLPSTTETCAQSGQFWQTSSQMRTTTGKNCWLRSSADRYGDKACYLSSSGNFSNSYSTVTTSSAVRPAIHLNLKMASQYISTPVEIPVTIPDIIGEYIYEPDITRLFTSTSFYQENKDKIETITDVTKGNNKDVGEYIAEVVLKDKHYVAGQNDLDKKDKQTKIKIIPKVTSTPQTVYADFTGEPIEIEKLGVAKVPWFNADRMALTYGATNIPPTAKGTYTVTVTLLNNLNGVPNYYFEGEEKDTHSLDISLVIDGTTIAPSGLNEVYNGTSFKDKITQQSWYIEKESLIERIEYGSDDYTSVGIHTFTVVLKNPESVSFKDSAPNTASKSFDVVISKKPIKINNITLNTDGTLRGAISLFDGYEYCGENNRPTFGLEYQKENTTIWQKEVPNAAGNYNVRAYITNPTTCFYELETDGNGQTTWKKEKIKVTLPKITLTGDDEKTKVERVSYTGEEQSFELVGMTSDIRLTNYSPNLFYDTESKTYKAKNVGEYSITVALANNESAQWLDDDNATLNERQITFKIEKVQLEVVVDEGTATSWGKGERQTLEFNIKGIKGNDDIYLKVSYTKDSGDNTPISYTKGELTNETAHITVDIGQFSTGLYNLYVELTQDTINTNYTIKKISTTTALHQFLITSAAITSLNIEWHASNVKLPPHSKVSEGYERTGAKGTSPEFSVKYNGCEFEVKINETLLPAGINIKEYQDNKSTDYTPNEGKTAKVILEVEDGYELFNSSTIKTFTISVKWKVDPAEFDLTQLLYVTETEYTGSPQGISLEEGNPSWITLYDAPLNLPTNVGTHTLTYKLKSSDINHNYIFTNPTGESWIRIDETNKDQAEVDLTLEITKAKIYLTQQDSGWKAITTEYTDRNNFTYYVPIPTDKSGNERSDYLDKLNIVYMDTSSNVLENGYSDIVNTGTAVTYYIRVTLNENAKNNYIIYNTTKDGSNFATYDFTVGDTRPQVELIYKFNGEIKDLTSEVLIAEFEYNGKPFEVSVEPSQSKYNYVTFTITYSKQGNGAEEPPTTTAPKEVGTYRVFVTDVSGNHFIINRTRYFRITELLIDIDDWQASNGEDLPIPNVIANMHLEKEWFDYEIYDKEGNLYPNKEFLPRNTHFTLKIVPVVDFIKFTDDAVVMSPVFKLNPDINSAINLGIPEFENNILEWNDEEQTFVIKNFNNLECYIENPDEVLEQLKQKDIKHYAITLKILEGLDAIFEGGLTEWTLTYDIVTRVLEQPKNIVDIGEITYTGNAINILSYLFGANWESYVEWLDFDMKNGVDYIQTNAGPYILIFKIRDEVAGNVVWKNIEIYDLETFALTREVDSNATIIEWEILPAKIIGTWNTSGAYPEFVITREDGAPDFSDKIEIKYFKDGVEVAKEDLVYGETYTAQLVLLDTDNLELDTESSVQPEREFTYTDPNKKEPGFFEKTLEFIKENLLWIVIGIVVLIFVILIIAIFKRRRRKYADARYSKYPPRGAGYDECDRRLVARGRDFERHGVRVYGRGNEILSDYEFESPYDDELEQLKAEVRRLKRYQLATEEEKQQSGKLANVENMLIQLLLNNFANKPNWIPFNNQDMINYSIEDLMQIYTKAKQLIETKMSNNIQNEKRLEAEALGFENKVASYIDERGKSQYEQLLKEVRELKDKVEASEKRQTEKELELVKQQLAKAESKLEQRDAEVENLKEQNLKHELGESVKKNEQQTIIKEMTKASVEKLEFNEAFNKLPENQKKYFETLEEYALKQPNAKSKPMKYHLSIGVGNTPYIKFIIKYNTLIAVFGTTEIKIEDDNSVEIAKQMIDKVVAQVKNKK